MPENPTLPVLRKNRRLCVDLRKSPELLRKSAGQWRSQVTKEFKPLQLVFASRDGYVCQDSDNEQHLEPGAVLAGRWSHHDDVYTPAGLRELIAEENKKTFDVLIAQLRSPMGVVPFVGAGLSVSFGYPGWPAFLKDAAKFHSNPKEVLAKIRANQLIDAASLLYKESPDRFQQLVEGAFGRPVGVEQVRTGALSLLPLISRGPVITTNFDRVLETAFEAGGAPFTNVVTAAEPDNVIRAMHRDEHVLIKIHGDALDRSARVFTGLEYDRRYGRSGRNKSSAKEPGIPQLARVMFTNRPLLFLGSSLEKDRTLEVLRSLHREVRGLTHYGVLAASWSLKRIIRRRLEINRYGIGPLWFEPQNFKRIESILQEALQEASTRPIWMPVEPAKAAAKHQRSGTAAVKAPAGARVAALQLTRAEQARIGPALKIIARRIAAGRMAFFLGAGAHLDPAFLALAFDLALAREYRFGNDFGQRAEMLQFMVDNEGKREAWEMVKDKLRAIVTPGRQPSPIYEFLAELPSLFGQPATARARRQWFFTTNYDTVLERVLSARGQPFHLLYYQVDGKYAGRFVHRDPEGRIRLIERPRNVRAFPEPAHVLIKLDGGIPWDDNIPETVALSQLDFSVSAGRLPRALPEGVRAVLRDRSLLILGSSLRDQHVKRLVRWSAGSDRSVKTWAVLTPVRPSTARFWAAAGVELIICELERFITLLRQEVDNLLAAPPSPSAPRP
jgi:hypothetical protein